MGKPELILDPAKGLRFRGPFDVAVIDELKLTNPTDRTVAYKVKTTAPKSYSVRPSSGLITSRGIVAIKVTLQPFNYKPDDKLRHRFMIQAAYANDDVQDLEAFWKGVQADDIMECRLKSVFELPGDSPAGKPEVEATPSPSVTPQPAAPSSLSSSSPLAPKSERKTASPPAAQPISNPVVSSTTSEESSQLRHRPVSDRSTSTSAPQTTTGQVTAKSSDSSNILLIALVLVVILVATVQFMYR